MVDGEGFGALPVLLAVRGWSRLDAVARAAAGVDDSEVEGLLRSGRPSPSLLRRLAPALGLHAADLFVIAGVEVPDDLVPVDHTAGSRVPELVRIAVALPPERRSAVREFVASLPQAVRELPVPAPPAVERYGHGPGAVLMRLARNRNLGWVAVAMTLLVVTGRYWSAATYGGVGRGTVPVTAELLVDFCAVLDVPPADLSVVTGVALPDPPAPAASVVAELIWDVRRLTRGQLQEVTDFAASLGR